MKIKTLFNLVIAGLMTASLAMPVFADNLPTDPIGGKPPAGTQPSFSNFATFKDQVLYQRAFEAVLWSMPMVSKLGMRRGNLSIGADENVVLAWSAGATPLLETLTTNNVSPYVVAMTDLRKGPVVLEIPVATKKASLFGQIADHWYQTFADIGPIGVDKGKGAKLLLTPPGYTGKVPEGYIEVKSVCFRPDFAFRSIPTPAGTPADAAALAKQIKMYYLSELPNPKPTKFIDPIDTRWSTLARYDERWFEDLNEIIQIEPAMPRDKTMMGLHKTIGIEKGKPYAPDAKTKKIYRQAAVDAYHYMEATFAEKLPGEAWWDNRKWRNIFFHDANMGFTWETEDLVDYDMRAVRPWFTAIYFPTKVAAKPPTMYIATMRDGNGDLLEAGKTYSLTVPKDVPIKQFWLLTIYDRETWAFIYSPQMLSGLSSRDTDKMTKKEVRDVHKKIN